MSGCLQELDWNARWKEAATRKWPDLGGRVEYWNKRAPSFPRHDVASTYVRDFLALLDPRPHWSVLDVGCGTGTLAIPLAGRVASVTAMDFSEGMIEKLVLGCRETNIGNVRALHAGWEDDWDAVGVGTHDVAIASRSLVVEDLEAAIRKLDRAARLQVCITSPAGDGPVDRRVLEAVGRPFQKGPDYIYVYNLLHELGIYANVAMMDSGEERTFKSLDEALAFHRMLIEDLDAAEEVRLKDFLARQLVARRGGWVLGNRPASRWATIWWRKEGAEPCPGTPS
ncbi:MAG TPA: methyltransferase domain-containing protein [Holophaga sp.]|nr:methyltransferase domain-containing protein [Holophaga sp.]